MYATAVYMLREWGMRRVPHAVVAYDGFRLVGFFRFEFNPRARRLRACGTWVDPAYRKLRVAAKLWRAALAAFTPATVFVLTTSTGGRALVRKMKRIFRRIKWENYPSP